MAKDDEDKGKKPAKPKKREKTAMESLLGKLGEGERIHALSNPNTVAFYEPKGFFPSGLSGLDAILGNGGFALGRMTEVYGPERTCKSELVRVICSSFLNHYKDGLILYYDQERALDQKKIDADPMFSNNMDRVSIGYAPHAESLFQRVKVICENVVKSAKNTPVLIVVDSLAALDAKEDTTKDIDDTKRIGPLARAMSSALPRIRPAIQESMCHVLIVNQIRSQAGKMGAPDESPGGRALKFWCDYRIRTSGLGQFRMKAKKKDEESFPDGLLIQYKTIKNKLAPPLREIEIPCLFAPMGGSPSGLSEVWSVFELLRGRCFKATSGGNYSGRINGQPVEFTKATWAMAYAAHREDIRAEILKWSDQILLKSVAPEETDEDEEGDDGGEDE